MRKIIFLLTFLILTTSALYGQDIKKCDATILLSTSKKIGTLTEKEIINFLLTFGRECRDNAEFSEWSNELLFDVLNKQTVLLVNALQKEKNKIDLNEILYVISSPILDENIDRLIEKVKETKADPGLKNKILDKLTIAKESYKN